MVELNDVFGRKEQLPSSQPKPEPAPATQQVPVNLTFKQAKRLISLHDALAQVYQDIPHCAEVAANHRKEARSIQQMMTAHLKQRQNGRR